MSTKELPKENEISKKMMEFIWNSPSCFHAVNNFALGLKAKGFSELPESEKWNISAGGKYFVRRNNSSIIAFTVPESGKFSRFSVTASHSDSPSFKIKENQEINAEGCYVKLNVERYGGMLCAPWFDRPLSVAGRVICRRKDSDKISFEERLVDVDRNLLMIPNLAIHMNRDANSGYEYNAQRDMLPVFSCSKGFGSDEENKKAEKNHFMEVVAESAGVNAEDIISYDLFLYNRQEGIFWGEKNEFISSPKLDDLQCAWSCYEGFVSAEKNESDSVNVFAVFDNEEVGSQTRQGADSTFLKDTLKRLNVCLGNDEENYYAAVASSLMISADNAHAVHPNYAEKADPVNRPVINGGPVIKFNAAQKYATDGISASVFKALCDSVKVPYQTFTNRSDMAGGSTLGNISGSQVSVSTVDIGLPQWAMHSPYETAGSLDAEMFVKVVEAFYKNNWVL